jgi:two-component system KDP operon response regulator KdpE
MKGTTILVIEDDFDTCELMKIAFQKAGAKVHTALNSREGLAGFYNQRPDLVTLDLMMPDIDGWSVCRQLRQVSDVPILIVSALGHEKDIVRGLDSGADDFITKPLHLRSLLAHARAIIRRSQMPSYTPHHEHILSYHDKYLDIDLKARRFVAGGGSVRLTNTEFRLLAYLLRNADRVLTFRKIMQAVWGQDEAVTLNNIHVRISHLREKLEPDPANPRYILSEHGIGYLFRRQARQEGEAVKKENQGLNGTVEPATQDN